MGRPRDTETSCQFISQGLRHRQRLRSQEKGGRLRRKLRNEMHVSSDVIIQACVRLRAQRRYGLKVRLQSPTPGD